MNIVIDARLINETGVGRYIRNLIIKLGNLDTEDYYVVLLLANDFDQFQLPNARWEKRCVDIHWHSVKEQLCMPWVLWREHADVVHIPYFNVPILYVGRFIVTIHDLTILHLNTGKASTLPAWKYILRRIGYTMIIWSSVYRSHGILTVSETVKQDILSHFKIPNKKIHVTYEGIDDALIHDHIESDIRPITERYFLYVGNVYPHKNVETLIESFSLLRKKISEPIKLVFVGPNDFFYKRLRLLITSLSMDDDIIIKHTVGDAELSLLYAHAIALVFPSRMEGFGLPALEAIAHGCAVIASDIPVFHEILQNHAHFADTTNPESLSRVMNEVQRSTDEKNKISPQRVSFLSRYSWEKWQRKHMLSISMQVTNEKKSANCACL